MEPLSPEKLVVLDYSGTLSLESPRFGQPVNLLSALAQSGLDKLGVATPEAFWQEIVGPTWTAGSTTGIGYKGAIAQRIEALGCSPGITGADIASAASRFVDLYLGHSRIEPFWRPVLETLTGDPHSCSIIATDHYAEATETIIRNLRAWNIPAQKTAEGVRKRNLPTSNPCLIANSADIGFWKEDRRFWETVKLQLGIAAFQSVLVIDDFGFNEEQGDSRAARPRVQARQNRTAASLQTVFQAHAAVIPFFLEGGEREGKEAALQRIEETVLGIHRYLSSAGITKGA